MYLRDTRNSTFVIYCNSLSRHPQKTAQFLYRPALFSLFLCSSQKTNLPSIFFRKRTPLLELGSNSTNSSPPYSILYRYIVSDRKPFNFDLLQSDCRSHSIQEMTRLSSKLFRLSYFQCRPLFRKKTCEIYDSTFEDG